jgi:hypothetical protein
MHSQAAFTGWPRAVRSERRFELTPAHADLVQMRRFHVAEPADALGQARQLDHTRQVIGGESGQCGTDERS